MVNNGNMLITFELRKKVTLIIGEECEYDNEYFDIQEIIWNKLP